MVLPSIANCPRKLRIVRQHDTLAFASRPSVTWLRGRHCSMQCLDAFREVVRDGRCGFERHSPACVNAGPTAIEAEPTLRIDQFAAVVDEIGHPQDTVTQVDRRFAALAPSQDLTQDHHGVSSLVTLMPDIFSPTISEIAKKLLKKPIPVGRPRTLGIRMRWMANNYELFHRTVPARYGDAFADTPWRPRTARSARFCARLLVSRAAYHAILASNGDLSSNVSPAVVGQLQTLASAAESGHRGGWHSREPLKVATI